MVDTVAVHIHICELQRGIEQIMQTKLQYGVLVLSEEGQGQIMYTFLIKSIHQSPLGI